MLTSEECCVAAVRVAARRAAVLVHGAGRRRGRRVVGRALRTQSQAVQRRADNFDGAKALRFGVERGSNLTISVVIVRGVVLLLRVEDLNDANGKAEKTEKSIREFGFKVIAETSP